MWDRGLSGGIGGPSGCGDGLSDGGVKVTTHYNL